MLMRPRFINAAILAALAGMAAGIGCGKSKSPHPAPAAVPEIKLDSALAAAMTDARAWLGESAAPPMAALEDSLAAAATTCAPRIAAISPPESAITIVREIIYKRWAIAFDSAQDSLPNLLPQCVLMRKRGACLGVSLLYLLLAERLHLPLYGVVMPGHFFIRYDRNGARINLEPNRGGFVYTDERYRMKYAVPPYASYYMRDLAPAEVMAVFYFNLGNIARSMGKDSAAAACFGSAAGLMPGFIEARGNLALALDAQGKSDSAIALLDGARRMQPENTGIIANLGALYLKAGKPKAARDVYETALSRAAEDPDLLYGMAAACYASGTRRAAEKWAEKCLQVKPGDERSRKLLEELRRR
jgi:regulator of sirC expression with transglutaminase-like and TPR domain